MRTVERPADQVDARRVGLWLNRNGWVNWSGLATLLADLPLTFASLDTALSRKLGLPIPPWSLDAGELH
jgi:hypothetical protein